MRQIVANEGISGTGALCAPPQAFQKWLVESDPGSSLREKYRDEFAQREYNQSWRQANTGMIQQATEDLGVMVRPSECLLIGHDLYEDEGLAKCLGIDFEFANPTNYNPGMFEPWVRG